MDPVPIHLQSDSVERALDIDKLDMDINYDEADD